ncbi:unnamed protein product [marine sediment metagenome]|uniref:Uncharacterized protein n=1 Tax=marine sediment metagenome TaxID=412755 RepID=X1LMI5_9ZZZZ
MDKDKNMEDEEEDLTNDEQLEALHLDKVEREIREEIEARIEKEEKLACINAIKTCIKHCDDDKFRCVKECVGQDDYEVCVNKCLSTYVECLGVRLAG